MLTSTKTTINGNDLTSVQTYELSFKQRKKPRIPRKLKKRMKRDSNKFWTGNPTKFYDHGTLWPKGCVLPESDPIRDITAAFNYYKDKGHENKNQ